MDDPNATGDEKDVRFHLASILVGVLDEAYVQHHVEHPMSPEEWRAWESTIDALMRRQYLARYWQLSRGGFNESFTRYLDERLALPSPRD
jgi:hypothetical protein